VRPVLVFSTGMVSTRLVQLHEKTVKHKIIYYSKNMESEKKKYKNDHKNI